jgi:hypothetical protein
MSDARPSMSAIFRARGRRPLDASGNREEPRRASDRPAAFFLRSEARKSRNRKHADARSRLAQG